jgi:glutamine synthetase
MTVAGRYARWRNHKELVASPEWEPELQQTEEDLRAAGVEAIYFVLPSVDGRALGKLVTIDHFAGTATKGIRLHYGAITDARADIFGELIGFGEEEQEGLGVPDLGTMRILPWEPRLAQVLCFFYDEDSGELLEHDSRGNLLRIEDLLERETGLRAMCGIEPEMMWLRKDGDTIEHTTSAKSFYEITNFHELQPILLDVLAYGRALQLDISHGDSEDSSQLEINTAPKTPLDYADDFFRYRQLCRVVARKHGIICTFMPKPFTGCSGNGHHHHVSLIDAEGSNAILGDLKGSCRLSETGVHFLGGILEHADAITLVGAPSVNSYKRFWDVGYWAPFLKSFDYNNRTSLVRIPAPGRFEVRQFDGSCNAYLSLGACIVAGLDGIRRRLDPGEPRHENVASDIRVPREDRVPVTLEEAIASFEADDLMHELFPPALHRSFLGLRRDELQRYWAQVSQWELDFYLERWP